jgi:hypothetical protein
MLPQFSNDKTVNFAHLLTRRFCTPARVACARQGSAWRGWLEVNRGL